MNEYLDRRYALALYEVAEEKNKVEEYLKELDEVTNLIMNDESFLSIIKHPHLSTSRKKEMFSEIFKGKISEDILSFLIVLIDKNRLLELSGQLEEFKRIDIEKNNCISAVVKTVISLDDAQRNELIRKLELKYHKRVLLTEVIDKDIIGGVYVRIGNDVIDGTIKSKFDEIKKFTVKVD